ncbi:hypothetical protein EHQ76_05610 [Leptospira barantonii]|uniref:Uncharacterized protein n=1 Tax=Leptospira barantonii TaxID=2023184 RepID=A0A5F2BS69_9LEPT|nr:hypothetical protein EHQ76_05610 [Leptospira barantonii]
MHSNPCPNLVNWKHLSGTTGNEKHKNYVFKKSEYCWIQNVRGRDGNSSRSRIYRRCRTEW